MSNNIQIFEPNYNVRAYDRLSGKIVTLEEPLSTLNHDWTYWIATDENSQYVIVSSSYLEEV